MDTALNKYRLAGIQQLAEIYFSDWVGYANAIKAMLWLDAKRYIDNNMTFIQGFVERYGKGWFCFHKQTQYSLPAQFHL